MELTDILIFHINDLASELASFTIREQGSFECGAWFEAIKNESA